MGTAAMNAAPHQSQVDKNFKAFNILLPELIKSHPGKFVVMHNEKAVEFFDSLSDAARFGHAKFGDHNFSVQEVTSQNINLGFHSYAIDQHSN
jgi:hypothetical protein